MLLSTRCLSLYFKYRASLDVTSGIEIYSHILSIIISFFRHSHRKVSDFTVTWVFLSQVQRNLFCGHLLIFLKPRIFVLQLINSWGRPCVMTRPACVPYRPTGPPLFVCLRPGNPSFFLSLYLDRDDFLLCSTTPLSIPFAPTSTRRKGDKSIDSFECATRETK